MGWDWGKVTIGLCVVGVAGALGYAAYKGNEADHQTSLRQESDNKRQQEKDEHQRKQKESEEKITQLTEKIQKLTDREKELSAMIFEYDSMVDNLERRNSILEKNFTGGRKECFDELKSVKEERNKLAAEKYEVGEEIESNFLTPLNAFINSRNEYRPPLYDDNEDSGIVCRRTTVAEARYLS
jgi:TolA-binding protein